MVALTKSLMSIMTIPMETSPSAIISSPIEDDFEKELIAELVDNFYKSSR